MCRNHSYNSKGFTLIEMLVALTIMAMLSIAAYQVLYQVQLSNSVSKNQTTRFNELQKALVVMNSDFRQIAARHFRTNDKEPEARLLLWESGILGNDGYGLIFTRFGWSNPQMQFPRGEVTKIGYRLNHGTLERIWWDYPDTTLGDAGHVMPILTQVDKFVMRFFYDKKWQNQWSKKDVLPQAIAIKLVVHDYGDIERIFLIAGKDKNSDESPHK